MKRDSQMLNTMPLKKKIEANNVKRINKGSFRISKKRQRRMHRKN
jgi:uncharacterized protein YjiK